MALQAMRARNAKGLAVRKARKVKTKAKKARSVWPRPAPAMRRSRAVVTRLIAKSCGSRRNSCASLRKWPISPNSTAIEAAVTGDRFQLDEGNGVIDVPSFINQGTRFLPSACPAAESFSLTTAGGRTFQLSYEPLCRAASDLSGLFVAVATVLAALYVGRAVGGQ